MALVVVDALRADTFFGEAFAGLRKAHPAAATGLVRTSPVSMSTAGVRSMATGTFPDLFDVLHNWDNVASDLPGVPGLARAAGRQTELFGDSIWRELFPKGFVVAETEVRVPRIIFYLRAETLVDETRVKRLAERLRKGPPPDFLVLHLVGLDHAGHRHGVKSAGYADIARRTVAHIENIVRLLPPDTVVLLTSDHGATDSGGHGGASEVETTAPLFAFGPGIVTGARVNINQIDLAPTLSCLLGLPFPATSLGRPAVELFDEPAPARLERLRAGLAQVEQAWAKPTGVDAGGDLGTDDRRDDDARALDARALDLRFAAILAAFNRNVARTRAPVALWGLVLLIFLIAQMGEWQVPRSKPAAAVALLLSVGVVLTAVSGRWSLLGLGLCLAGASIPCALAEWKRTRFASPVHLVWLLSAGAAVLLALARNHQGRRTTLLFGSPSDVRLAIGGAVLCLALRALEQGVRASTKERSSYSGLMLPIVVPGRDGRRRRGHRDRQRVLRHLAALGRRRRLVGAKRGKRVANARGAGGWCAPDALPRAPLAPHLDSRSFRVDGGRGGRRARRSLAHAAAADCALAFARDARPPGSRSGDRSFATRPARRDRRGDGAGAAARQLPGFRGARVVA